MKKSPSVEVVSSLDPETKKDLSRSQSARSTKSSHWDVTTRASRERAFEQSDSNAARDKEDGPQAKRQKSEEIILEKSNLFWKITRPHYSLQFICCKLCNDYNFKNKKFVVSNDRLFVTLSFCPSCVKSNYTVSDLHSRKSS